MSQLPPTGLLQKAGALLSSLQAAPIDWKQSVKADASESQFLAHIAIPPEAAPRNADELLVTRHMLSDMLERAGYISGSFTFEFPAPGQMDVRLDPMMYLGAIATTSERTREFHEMDADIAFLRERLGKGQAISLQQDEEEPFRDAKAHNFAQAQQQLAEAIAAGWEKREGSYVKPVTISHGEAQGEFFFPEVTKALNALAEEPLLTTTPQAEGTGEPGKRNLKEDLSVSQANYNKMARLIGISPLEATLESPVHKRISAFSTPTGHSL